jgi:periplasmic protein CpxP/Spy
MPTPIKNKWLLALVIGLIIVNAVTITVFWLDREKQPSPPPHEQGGPANYLIRELGLDSRQQQQYMQLVNEHRQAAEQLRRMIREEKDRFFGLLRQDSTPDSVKKAAAASVSRQTAALDLLTFDHFQKVRAICTPAQQEKFDHIIQQVTAMMGGPGPGGPPPGDPSPGNSPLKDSLLGKQSPPAKPLPGKPPVKAPHHRLPPPPGDFPPDGPPPGPHGDRPPPPPPPHE